MPVYLALPLRRPCAQLLCMQGTRVDGEVACVLCMHLFPARLQGRGSRDAPALPVRLAGVSAAAP